jgi:hypothetical protein
MALDRQNTQCGENGRLSPAISGPSPSCQLEQVAIQSGTRDEFSVTNTDPKIKFIIDPKPYNPGSYPIIYYNGAVN